MDSAILETRGMCSELSVELKALGESCQAQSRRSLKVRAFCFAIGTTAIMLRMQ